MVPDTSFQPIASPFVVPMTSMFVHVNGLEFVSQEPELDNDVSNYSGEQAVETNNARPGRHEITLHDKHRRFGHVRVIFRYPAL